MLIFLSDYSFHIIITFIDLSNSWNYYYYWELPTLKEILDLLVACLNYTLFFGDSKCAGSKLLSILLLIKTSFQENRTVLHLAIDKSFMDIAVAILEKKPNLEIRNKVSLEILTITVKICSFLIVASHLL